MTTTELENSINRLAKTSIKLHGNIGDNSLFSGHIEGCSQEEIYNFIKHIADKRGKAFEQVAIRLGAQNPPTFTCRIDFDAKYWDQSKTSLTFFERLFGTNSNNKPKSIRKLERALDQVKSSLQNDFGCNCFIEYKSIIDYKSDSALETQLPLILMKLGIRLNEVMFDYYYVCKLAVEVNEYDNIVSRGNTISLWNFEEAVAKQLKREVMSIGVITKDGKRFKTIFFIVLQK